MDCVLIDTDVLLDFFFDRKPFSHQATQVLSLCERKEINGFITPVIIANVYYLLRKTAKHEYVVSKINQLLNILYILSMDRDIITRALNSKFKDFGDALQNFSAERDGEVQIVITRNIKDFKQSDLSVLSPDTYLRGRPAT